MPNRQTVLWHVEVRMQIAVKYLLAKELHQVLLVYIFDVEDIGKKWYLH